MVLSTLFRGNRLNLAAHNAYVALVDQARDVRFFRDFGVPDTLDGRFETIALHAFLVLRRLKAVPGAQKFSQLLFDTMFADMDRSLRELGNSDLGVGKQVKLMATAFYGRIAAYDAGLDGTGDLNDALRRNLFGTVPDPDPVHVQWFEAYIRRQAAWLEKIDGAKLTGGKLNFEPM